MNSNIVENDLRWSEHDFRMEGDCPGCPGPLPGDLGGPIPLGRAASCPGWWRGRVRLSALLLGLALVPLGHASERSLSQSWRWSNPLPHGANVVDQATDSRWTVQVGERGQVYLSENWERWMLRSGYTTAALRGATFFDGRLVVTGEAGTVLFADDPWGFRRVDLGTSDWLESVAASSDRVVAVGDRAAIYTSTDAINWQRIVPSFKNWLRSVACHGTVFVTVGEGGLIATSNSGTNWQVRSSGLTVDLNRVAWLGDQFMAVGDGGVAVSSPNGTQWRVAELGTDRSLYATAGEAGSRLAAGELEVVLSEADGPWASQVMPGLMAPAPCWQYYAALWQQEYHLLAGQSGMLVEGVKSNNIGPVAWRPLGESVRSWLWSVTRTPTHYVAVGDLGTILSSPDGIDWDLELVPWSVTNAVLLGVGAGPGLLLAVGSRGTVLWGTNVYAWHEVQPAPSINDLQAVAYDAGQFLLAGGNGTVLTSADGTNWTEQATPTDAFLMSAVSYPGGWVVVGENGVILSSGDGGRHWSLEVSGTTNWLSQVRWLNERLIAVGENGTILESVDGVQWRLRESGTTAWLNAVDSVEGTWVAVGNQGTVLISQDGTRWSNVGTLTRKSLYGVAIHEGQLVTVGSEGAILRARVLPDLTPIAIADFHRAASANIFLFTGAPDQRFRLESSPDLTEWREGPHFEFVDSSGTAIYLEELGTNAPGRQYYRARLE